MAVLTCVHWLLNAQQVCSPTPARLLKPAIFHTHPHIFYSYNLMSDTIYMYTIFYPYLLKSVIIYAYAIHRYTNMIQVNTEQSF